MSEHMSISDFREWVNETIKKEAGLSALTSLIGDDALEVELANDQVFLISIHEQDEN